MKLPVEFQFIDVDQCETVHSIPIGRTGRIDVIGQTGDAAYEWLIWRGDILENWSDAGYGDAAAALRDGLISALGDDDVIGGVR